jgi:uroporphyrin-III C-methyltransferase
MTMLSGGMVYLVGAGPGDPELITLKALRCIRHADVILYDSLLSNDLLAEARRDALVIHMGKRGYCIGSTRQQDIQEAMVEYARQGKSVCRLKGGDPLFFGRAGEEMEYLAAAGIPYEVIPGITSAQGACASSNIPLTHRQTNQSITFVTAHHDPDSQDCQLDWDVLARLDAIVFYMGLRHLLKITRRLIACGMSPSLSAAVMSSATLAAEKLVEGTLADLAYKAEQANIQAPALIIVGEMVARRQFSMLQAHQSRMQPCR